MCGEKLLRSSEVNTEEKIYLTSTNYFFLEKSLFHYSFRVFLEALYPPSLKIHYQNF